MSRVASDFPGGAGGRQGHTPKRSVRRRPTNTGGNSVATLWAGLSCIRREALRLLGDALGHRLPAGEIPARAVTGLFQQAAIPERAIHTPTSRPTLPSLFRPPEGPDAMTSGARNPPPNAEASEARHRFPSRGQAQRDPISTGRLPPTKPQFNPAATPLEKHLGGFGHTPVWSQNRLPCHWQSG